MLIFNKYLLIELGAPNSCSFQYLSGSKWFLSVLSFHVFIFNFFCLRWVSVAARGLSLIAESGDYSLLWYVGPSLWWLLLLGSGGSRHTGFSNCSTQAQ